LGISPISADSPMLSGKLYATSPSSPMPDAVPPVADAISPVSQLALQKGPPAPIDATALALSGGGYSAMLFHTGVLWRLHENGQLAKLRRISSVSGGSIVAALLGLKWKRSVGPGGRGGCVGAEVGGP